jgi:hypothetical protein
LTFKLPFEEDRSGVYNLLFQSGETGGIYLLDTINEKDNERLRTRFMSSKYNAILLYNNGKYIVFKDITFTENTNTVIDMRKYPLLLPDSISQSWLSLRAFNTPIGERGTLRKNYTTRHEKKCRGYVFHEEGCAIPNKLAVVVMDNNKRINGALDGYIEFEFELNQEVKIVSFGINPYKIQLTENCGLFIITEETDSYEKK